MNPDVGSSGTVGERSVRVLLVDDDELLARALQRTLRCHGFSVDVAYDGVQAIERVAAESYDVMLLDLRLANMSGLDVFQSMRGRPMAPPTILHSGYLDIQTAVLATRSGVWEVLEKPVPELTLVERLRDAAVASRTEARAAAPVTPVAGQDDMLRRLVGGSRVMASLRESVQRVARFRDLSVLIQGPTGTGKELVAEAIHSLTNANAPFISINCAAVPEHLFESELFGHEAGSFTSARGARAGLLEDAGDGTIFLDEVGEMPLSMQAKLLRVLETREFRRVGSNRIRTFSARIVSATNRPLLRELGESMRSDLYFRLAGYTITTPSLVDRKSDIAELARYFLSDFSLRHRVNLELSLEGLDELAGHPFPGNVRELRAVVEHAGILAREGRVGLSEIRTAIEARAGVPVESSSKSLPPPRPPLASGEYLRVADGAPPSSDQKPSLPALQREFILRAFAGSGQNLSRAARELGIPRSTLRDRLRRYGAR